MVSRLERDREIETNALVSRTRVFFGESITLRHPHSPECIPMKCCSGGKATRISRGRCSLAPRIRKAIQADATFTSFHYSVNYSVPLYENRPVRARAFDRRNGVRDFREDPIILIRYQGSTKSSFETNRESKRRTGPKVESLERGFLDSPRHVVLSYPAASGQGHVAAVFRPGNRVLGVG